MALPAPAHDQAYCNVSALEAGMISLPFQRFVQDGTPGVIIHAPSLAFLIQHSKREEKFLFDLGIRKEWQSYPPAVISGIENTFPIEVPQDVVESLAKGGLSPTDITTCCLSHCHWDHTGDTNPFATCTFIVGAESADLFKPGYPTEQHSGFAEDLLPIERTTFISTENWQPVGPFPRGHDFYGDGSLYLIDARGHLPGHLNVLARTSADGAWIFLAGDSAHHRSLLTGETKIAKGPPGWRSERGCAHMNKEEAEAHISRIRVLLKESRTRVLLAHDESWYAENKLTSSFWPGNIPSL